MSVPAAEVYRRPLRFSRHGSVVAQRAAVIRSKRRRAIVAATGASGVAIVAGGAMVACTVAFGPPAEGDS